MSVDIGESLMHSWLKHVKRCDIVQTNWKASMHGAFDKSLADDLFAKIQSHPKFSFFAPKKTAANIIRQAEIDALGCVVEKKRYIACEIAFHEDGLHYSAPRKVEEKILSTLLCLYGYLNAKEATVVFATPYIQQASYSDALKQYAEDVNDFLHNICGLPKYHVLFFSNLEFERSVLNPVLYLVDEIKDNSEVFVRACKLIHTTKKAADPYRGTSTAKCIKTKSCGEIDVSGLDTKELIESFVVPILSNMSARKLTPYFSLPASSSTFKVSFPFLSVTRNPAVRYYAKSYYLEKTKQDVFITSQCANRDALIEWISANALQ